MASTLHAKVVDGVIGPREIKDEDEALLSVPDTDGGPRWRPIVEIGADLPVGDGEIKVGPVEAIEPTQVTRTWTVRAMTADELSAKQARDDDEVVGDDSAIKKGAVLLVALIDHEIAAGRLLAADFPADVRQIYQDFKAAVDRIRQR